MPVRRDLLLSALGLGAISALPQMVFAQSEDTAATGAPEIVEMALGDPDAPVTMIEYASFTCPHCAAFHQDVMKDLRANYIDTGKVRFIYREVYFDRFGLWASMLARCGGEMRFFGIADRLYSAQREWTAAKDPAQIADNLRRIGLTSGLSQEQVDACLGDAEMAKGLVAWYQENAERDGVQSTPSFLIDGEKYSNMDYEGFAEVLDEKLGS